MMTADGRIPSRPGWRRLWPLALLGGAIAVAFALGLDRHLSAEALAANHAALAALVRANPAVAAGGFVLVYAAAVAVSLPGAVFLTLSGGLLFGHLWGTVLSVIGATIGAVLLFLAARHALADLLASKAGPLLDKVRPGLERDGLSYLLVLRIVPLVPFWLVNLAPALVGMRLGPYALGTFLGIIPATTVFAGIGAGLGEILAAGGRPDLGVILSPGVLLPLLGLALLALVPVVRRRIAARRAEKSHA
ncbi:TVP38/TMEM64 family protein [Elioraea tepidiphila]|uniref:TVP38/TMEM64 family protein n=2 Tax=Elioraea tepidiphila TaxID=457934 RepID=UPI0003721A61|nr:VTT domain-containing protein [Elioraea tepidiphila]